MSLCARRITHHTLWRLMGLCFLLNIAVARLVHPATAPGQDLADGFRGAMIGVELGLAFLLLRGRRHCRAA